MKTLKYLILAVSVATMVPSCASVDEPDEPWAVETVNAIGLSMQSNLKVNNQ